MSIYIDESGDLGARMTGGSGYFVICALATSDPVGVSRIPKKVRRRLQLDRTSREMKFNSSCDRVRSLVLEHIAASDSRASWCAMYKKPASRTNTRDKGGIFRRVLENALSPIASSATCRRISVTLDKRNEGWFRGLDIEGFVTSILTKSHGGYFPPEVRVSFYESHNDGCLQVTDYVCGAVFQMVERGVYQYYEVVKDIMVGELILIC
jgi:hypothetical protein